MKHSATGDSRILDSLILIYRYDVFPWIKSIYQVRFTKIVIIIIIRSQVDNTRNRNDVLHNAMNVVE